MLVVALPELSQGVYQVKWSITLLDGDVSQGEYYFGIGDVAVPAAPVQPVVLATTPNPQAASSQPVALWLVIGTGLVFLLAIGIYFVQKIVTLHEPPIKFSPLLPAVHWIGPACPGTGQRNWRTGATPTCCDPIQPITARWMNSLLPK